MDWGSELRRRELLLDDLLSQQVNGAFLRHGSGVHGGPAHGVQPHDPWHGVYGHAHRLMGSCFSNAWFDQDKIFLLGMVRSRLHAQGYTPQDINGVFEEVDEDGSGEIDYYEFRKLIKTFNLRSVTAAKWRLFHYFDRDRDGAINFTNCALTLRAVVRGSSV